LSLKDEQEIQQILDDSRVVEEDQRIAGRLMLAMVLCGTTNADKIAKVTGTNRELCRVVFRRLRDNGIIMAPGTIDVQWFNDNPELAVLAFIMDILVAQGSVRRGEPKEKRPTYITASENGSLEIELT
jgi:hypothetical protein